MSSSNRFGFVWAKYPDIVLKHEEQFLRWIHPLTASSFEGKRVLDAGCGTGRNSFWALKYGADVVAFDIEKKTVAVAQKNLGLNGTVRCQSIYDIEYNSEFDIVFSIGVIHHLEYPKLAVDKLVKATKSGGTVLVWVYGKEGHTSLKSFINAVRPVTSKLSISWLHTLTYPISFVWFLLLRLHLYSPSHPYMKLLRGAKFWHIHSIVVDQLLPQIAEYWTKEEAIRLFESLSVKHVQAHFCNEGSWSVCATKI